jgi:hypothetical protein
LQVGVSQVERARQFHGLHHGPTLLRMGSVWDAASAVVFEREGFPRWARRAQAWPVRTALRMANRSLDTT